MPAPEVVIPLIEGHIGSLAGADESVALWVKLMKQVMLSGTNKDQTDWEFIGDLSIVEAASVISATAVDVYGILIGIINADAERKFFVMTDTAAGAFAGESALDNDDLWVYQIPAAATVGTMEYWPHVFPKGINFPAGLDLAADGRDGTTMVASDVAAWVVYRS
jgi:hypothetical protein